MKKYIFALFGPLFAFFSLTCQAQDNIIEFNPDIKGAVTPNDIDFQSDGKIILAAGDLVKAGSQYVDPVIRLNQDGSLDTSFNIDIEINTVYFEFITKVCILEDDKFIVAGGDIFPDFPNTQILKFNKDGSRDETFQPNFNAEHILDVKILPDNKLLIICFNQSGSVKPVFRVNQDGSIDETYNFEIEKMRSSILPATLQSDGKLVMSGIDPDTHAFKIFRFNTDGSLDETFTQGESTSSPLFLDVEVQSDDKILVGGDFSTYNGIPTSNLIRLDPDGSIDESFVVPFEVAKENNAVNYIEVLNNDDFILRISSKLMKLHSGGNYDNTFSTYSEGYSNPVIKEYSNNLLVFGSFTYYEGLMRFGIAMLNSEGMVTDFNANLSGLPLVHTISLQDQTVLIGGEFYVEGNNNKILKNLARFNLDGSQDVSFNSNLGEGFDHPVNETMITDEGAIYVGGMFGQFNGQQGALIKLLGNGLVDNAFQTKLYPHGFDYGVTSMAYIDGEIVVGGQFSVYVNGKERHNLVKVDAVTGAIAGNYNADDIIYTSDYAEVINDIDFQSTGRLVVFGRKINQQEGILMRLDSMGNLDATFNAPDMSKVEVQTGLVSENDDIIFGSYQWDDNPIFRLDPEGVFKSKIRVFNSTHTYPVGPLALLEIETGHLIFGGQFNKVEDNDEVDKLGEIISDKAIDGFNLSFERSADIRAIVPFDAEHVIVGGSFKSINDVTKYSSIAIIKFSQRPKVISYNGISSIDEDTKLSLSLEQFELSNVENSSLTLSIKNGNNFTVEGNEVIPDLNYNGYLDIPISADNGQVESEIFIIRIDVLPVNDEPALSQSLEDILINEGFESYSINLPFYDVDGDVLNMSLNIEDPLVLDATVENNTLFIIEKSYGSTNVTVTADDGNGASRSESFEFIVNAVPVLTKELGDTTIVKGMDINLSDHFYDPDGDILNYTAQSSTLTNISLEVNDAVLSISGLQVGEDTVKVTANDQRGGSVTSIFNVSVLETVTSTGSAIDNFMAIYPNPVNDRLWVSLDTQLGADYFIKITSVDGKTCWYKDSGSLSDTSLIMDLSVLEPGIYFLVIYTDNHSPATRTIIKE